MTARFVVTAKLKDKVAVLDLNDFIEEYYPVEVIQDLMSRTPSQFISLVSLRAETHFCRVSALSSCIAEYYAQQTRSISGRAKLAGMKALLYVVRAKDGALYAFSASDNICVAFELPIIPKQRNGVVRVPTFATNFGYYNSSLPFQRIMFAEIKARNGGTAPVNVRTIGSEHLDVVFLNESNCEKVTLSSEMLRTHDLVDIVRGLRDTCVKNLFLDLVRPNEASLAFHNAFECNSTIETVISSPRMTCRAEDFHCTFAGCSSLVYVNLGSMNTSAWGISSLDHMFADCTSLVNADLRWLDRSMIRNTTCMFYGCKSLRTVDFQRGVKLNFDLSLSCYNMFKGCDQLSLSGVGVDSSLSLIKEAAIKWIRERDSNKEVNR